MAAIENEDIVMSMFNSDSMGQPQMDRDHRLNHKDSTYRHCQSVILIFIDTGLWIADSGKRTFVYFFVIFS